MKPPNPDNQQAAVKPLPLGILEESLGQEQELKLPAREPDSYPEISVVTPQASLGNTKASESLKVVSESGTRTLSVRLSRPSGTHSQIEDSEPMTLTMPTKSSHLDQFPTPPEIKAYLDTRVHGQEEAKKTLASAVYQHYFKLQELEDRTSPASKNQPKHILLIGPTGTGKTELVRTLAQQLNVPILFCNAASITAEGYYGDSVLDILQRYAKLCDFEPAKMERGIIFLDEFDKLRSNDGPFDVRGRMVQQELLSALDGNVMNRENKSEKSRSVAVDTRKILFIAAGAFAELTNPNQELDEGCAMGFLASKESSDHSNAEEITPQRIEQYGIVRELVARFPSIATLDPLTTADLVAIMQDTFKSPLAETTAFFDAHGISLEITEEAMTEIARQAMNAGLGARGLPQLLNRHLDELVWQVTDLNAVGVKRIRIDEKVIRQEALPVAELRPKDETSPVLPHIPAVATSLGSTPSPLPPSWNDYITARIDRMTDESINERLLYLGDILKASLQTRWWNHLMQQDKPHLLLRFLEELLIRNTSLPEFVKVVESGEPRENPNLGDSLMKFDEYRASRKNK